MVEALEELGLTTHEAQAYLAAVKLGLSTAVQIAREADLQRTEIYRLMSRLVSLGLVDETLDKPKRYKVSEIQRAMRGLADGITAKLANIPEKSAKLASELEAVSVVSNGREETPNVRIVSGLRNIRRNVIKMVASARDDFWVIASTPSAYAPSRSTSKILETIASKGIRARVIAEVDKYNVRLLRRMGRIVEIRHHDALGVNLYGIDTKAAGVGLSIENGRFPVEAADLLTNYPDYVALMRAFFDSVWSQSIPLSARIASMRSTQEWFRQPARIIWGRQEIYKSTGDWFLRAKESLTEIVSPNGPIRILGQFEKGLVEAKQRGIKYRIICQANPQNIKAVKRLSKFAEVRHIDRPFGIGIVVLDDSEATVEYFSPDSSELTTSAADVALYTKDRPTATHLLHMLDSIWRDAVPIERQLRKLGQKTTRPRTSNR
jgi:sugar-specific transcriptional regulator TrmB